MRLHVRILRVVYLRLQLELYLLAINLRNVRLELRVLCGICLDRLP